MREDVPGAVVKVIEVVGSSSSSFSDAVRNAVKVASRTIRNIKGVDVISSSAEVGQNGELSVYKVNCKIAFLVEGTGEGTVGSRGDLSEMASNEPGTAPYAESGGPDLER